MENEIKDLLGEEIKTQIENLSNLKDGSPEKSKAIGDLTTLYKLRIDETKAEMDFEEKRERRIMDETQMNEEMANRAYDERLKRDQLKEQVKERYFKLGIAVAELGIPLIFYGIWMNKGFKFEETGTFTSATFKGLINRFRPTKR